MRYSKPYTKVVDIPPNTTSLIQQRDQGIIRAVEAHHCSEVCQRMLDAVEKSVNAEQFGKTVLDAMFKLKRSMVLITPTIQNCIWKGKSVVHASQGDVAEVIEDEDEWI